MKLKTKIKTNKPETLVVKRRGHNEPFDERKCYASCYFACLGIAMEKQHAEKLCERVVIDMKRWLKGRKQVDSQDIFETMVKIIARHNKDAAFMYETHRDIS